MKNLFYIVMILLGFVLILIDLTPGHQIMDHLVIFKGDPDILGATILIFFGGFELGKRV